MIRDEHPSSALSYYVYYRVRSGADHQDARRRICTMQDALATAAGVRGRLMARYDDDATWMEIYEPVADPRGFEIALQQAVEAAGIDTLIEPGSARHLERFITAAADQ